MMKDPDWAILGPYKPIGVFTPTQVRDSWANNRFTLLMAGYADEPNADIRLMLSFYIESLVTQLENIPSC